MKIAIIGAGMVGSTAAFYLSQDHDVTLYDDGHGQATKAAAGIICPWFSKRRNKPWYRLANGGAHFYRDLLADLAETGIETTAYQQKTTWLLKKKPKLIDDLMAIAQKRQVDAPLIQEIHKLSPSYQQAAFPAWRYDGDLIQTDAGAVVDGQALCQDLLAGARTFGLRVKDMKVSLDKISDHEIIVKEDQESYDIVVLTSGAWLPSLLIGHDYQVDIRPQKGQLAVIQTDWDTSQIPLIMPEGEGDIIPHLDGKIFIGATHEDEKGYDLSTEPSQLADILSTAYALVPELADFPVNELKVGTRAYASDYAPFYGPIPDQANLYVASGLGSSGLTTGPLIGRELARMINGEATKLDPSDYPVGNYISRD
ncbi:FAD-binding oxidoreductase [Aerococcus agrisoli]|uniref:FAD-binding oxidoreductase n=1 Tax=Aerococcus agrisoli TaxID=2487350 RepID=A0A3N4GGC0_9LACT|nr:FAD-binding oxidoreductase [Aerococcus agrisoli]RPA60447.1 FAD-binding oxidoreductase [Aerococcus agrisoli]